MRENDKFAQYLGIELLDLTPGYCKVSLQMRDELKNGLGIPHGGAIFSMADFAFACASNSHGTTAVALSMDIHFITSPPVDALLICVADEVRCGRNTGLYRMQITDDTGKLCAELHGMVYRKNEPLPIPG